MTAQGKEGQSMVRSWSHYKAALRDPEGRLEGENFSMLTDNNKFFNNEFVCINYHLYNISIQIIECIIFAPYDFLQ